MFIIFFERSECLLNVFHIAKEQDSIIGSEYHIRCRQDELVIGTHGDDIQIMLFTDIKFCDRLVAPVFRHAYLIDIDIMVDLEHIKYIIKGFFCCYTNSSLFFRVYCFIGAVAKQELLLDIVLRTGDHLMSAKLFQERCRFERILEAGAYGDDAHIKIGNTN